MPYSTIETKKINWPEQANLPGGPAAFPYPDLDNVPAEAIGYDQTGGGNGSYVEGTGVQFRNTLNRTVLFLGRSKPDEVVVLDQALAEAIRLELGLDETIVVESTSVTRPITRQDLVNLRKLSASNVTDLTGLSYCTNLKTLRLGGTFTNINELRGLTNLERLDLNGCQDITSLAAVNDLNLIVLNIQGIPYSAALANQINSFPPLQVIEDSDLYGERVREFELTLLPNPTDGDSIVLTYLLRHDTNTGRYNLLLLDRIDTHAYEIDRFELTLTDDTVIGEIDPANISHQNIFLMLNTGMKIKALDSLDAVLFEADTELLDPAGAIDSPDEQEFTLTDANLITALTDYCFVTGDLYSKYVINLTKFIARGYDIEGIAGLARLRNLEHLDLSFNEITEISTEHFPALTHLDIMNNQITDAPDITYAANLTYLNVVGVTYSSDLEDMTDTIVSNDGVADTNYSINNFPVVGELEVIDGDAIERIITFRCSYDADSLAYYGDAIMINNTDSINSISVYNGALCEEPDPEHLLLTIPYIYSAKTVESVVSTNPTVVEVTAHGYTSGDTVEISAQHFIIEVVNANEITLLNTDYVPSTPISIGHSSFQINHDVLATLGTNFFMIFKSNAFPNGRFRLDYTYEHADQLYALYDAALNSNNQKPITSASERQVTAATNTEPINIEFTGPALDDYDTVQIEGVGGNTAANGQFVIEGTAADAFDLLTSEGNDTYTSGGTIRPMPSNATGGLTTRVVVNPFLEKHIMEMTVTHTQQNPTIMSIQDQERIYYQIDPAAMSEVIDNVNGVDIYEYTTARNFHQAELALMTLPDPLDLFVNIFSGTYVEGAICTPQRSRFLELAEMNNVYVKIITTQEVDGFAVDDLIVTLPPVGNYPKMIGPFSATFHATSEVNNRQYNDFIQLEFASDIVGAIPTSGDIQVAAYRLGA